MHKANPPYYGYHPYQTYIKLFLIMVITHINFFFFNGTGKLGLGPEPLYLLFRRKKRQSLQYSEDRVYYLLSQFRQRK